MKTILAPVDFSNLSEAVFDRAVELAVALRGRVVLLTVIQPPVITSEYAPILENIAEASVAGERAAAKLLAHFQKRLKARSIPVQTVQADGLPVEHIVRQADKLKADYIVIGSRGHTALYDLLVGGTAHGVIKKAKCPVVVVPPHRKAPRRRAKR